MAPLGIFTHRLLGFHLGLRGAALLLQLLQLVLLRLQLIGQLVRRLALLLLNVSKVSIMVRVRIRVRF